MPYCSMDMPIVWNELNMPTEGCSVHMPIVITNFKVRGVKQNSVPYMMKIILTHIPISSPTFQLNQCIGPSTGTQLMNS